MATIAEQLKAEGRQEGLQLGLTQGVAQGVAQGVERGFIKAKQMIAIKLLRQGESIEAVAALTELSKIDIEMLVATELTTQFEN